MSFEGNGGDKSPPYNKNEHSDNPEFEPFPLPKKVLSHRKVPFFSSYSAGVSAFSIADPAVVVSAELRMVYMT